jgi:hypothetical protein
MAIINLQNGLEGQDYTAEEVRAEERGGEFLERLDKSWGAIEDGRLDDAICTDVICSSESELSRQEFLARYLEHPAANNVVVG